MTAADHTTAATHTVLVIDDEDYVADMIASALDLEGYQTYVAYNGRDGLAHAAQTAVDLVIIDIMMPYLSGLALVQQLRQEPRFRRVPVILISAGARPREAASHVRFVPKPFDLEQLTHYVGVDIAAAKEDGQ